MLSLVVVCLALVAGDRIEDVPGYHGPPLFFAQYSGYITVNESHGRNLFYWFVESSRNSSGDPLVVWFNGGPGCSSMAGLWLEHGPFHIHPKEGNDVRLNPLAWTRGANILYVESPAGVGFSYSDTPSDYHTNDIITAEDNYEFLRSFMKQFPNFKKNNLWLAGESYAGQYVPALADKILHGPDVGLRDSLRGLFIGNPIFDCVTLNVNATTFQNLYWHGLISYTVYGKWKNQGCDTIPSSVTTGICSELYTKGVKEVGWIFQEIDGKTSKQPNLDPDDLYLDFCTGNGTLNSTTTPSHDCHPEGFSYLDEYLNRKDVQKAIFVDASKMLSNWSICQDKLDYQPSGISMIPTYKRILSATQGKSFDILIYSGDVDIATVPFAWTQTCLEELDSVRGRSKSSWRPWTVNGATAGYWEQFDGYTFATVKAAGHTVPIYQPLEAYTLFDRFVNHQNLTEVSSGDAPSVVMNMGKGSPSLMGGWLRRHRGYGL